MQNKTLKIILSSVALLLSITLSISVVSIIQADKKITKKETIKHTRIDYADEEFVDYIQDVIDDVSDFYDNDYLDDEISEDDEEDEEITDDLDWLEDEETEQRPDYASKISKYGTTPANNSIRNVNVNTSNTVFEDFYGHGGVIFPEILSDDAVSGGYNSVAWEYERKMIVNSALRVSRVPVDTAVIITDVEEDDLRLDYENNKDYQLYMSGCYDFVGSNAESVWQNFDALKEAGTTILFDIGWKVKERTKVWFPDVQNSWESSAPYDINAFVRASVAWLLEAEKRGYNIEFVYFGNEVNNNADFVTQSDKLKYLTTLTSAMISAIDYAKNNTVTYYSWENGQKVKREAKLKNATQVMPYDGITSIKSMFNKYIDHVQSIVDALGKNAPKYSSFHKYYYNRPLESDYYRYADYERTYSIFSEIQQKSPCKNFVTEFFASSALIDKEAFSKAEIAGNVDACIPGAWDTSYASFFISAANTGMVGMTNWAYASSYYPVKKNLKSYNETAGHGQMFSCQNGIETLKVAANYRLVSLLQQTVPQNSDVLMSNWEGDDVRVASFKLADGGYTFVVESKASDTEKTLNLNLDKAVGKKLYKYTFIDAENQGHNDLNGTLIQPDKAYDGTQKTISDTLGKDYSVTVYSTVAPASQVVIKEVATEIDATGTAALEVSELLNCASDAEIEWQITAATKKSGESLTAKNLLGSGEGKVNTSDNLTANGLKATFDPKGQLKSGDSVAIRATVKGTDAYSVALVYIK